MAHFLTKKNTASKMARDLSVRFRSETAGVRDSVQGAFQPLGGYHLAARRRYEMYCMHFSHSCCNVLHAFQSQLLQCATMQSMFTVEEGYMITCVHIDCMPLVP